MSVTTDDLNTSFKIIFHNGYIFRNIIEFISKCNLQTNIKIHKKMIYFTEVNETSKVLCEFKIYTSELIDYEFNSEYDIYVLSFDSKTFVKSLKSISTKKTLLLEKKVGNPRIFMYSMDSPSSRPQSADVLHPLINSKGIINILPPPFKRNDFNPTCKATVIEFSDYLQKCCSQGHDSVVIRGTETSLNLVSKTSSTADGTVAMYGKPEKNNLESRPKINIQELDFNNLVIDNTNSIVVSNVPDHIDINKELMTKLVDIKKIAHKGLVKFYYETIERSTNTGTIQEKMLKMTIPIGNEGLLTLYISS